MFFSFFFFFSFVKLFELISLIVYRFLLSNIFKMFCVHFVLYFFCIRLCLFVWKTKASFVFPFAPSSLRFVNEKKRREKKYKWRNLLAVLRSCCNEALEGNSSTSLAVPFVEIVTATLHWWQYFAEADRKSTWNFRISFATYMLDVWYAHKKVYLPKTLSSAQWNDAETAQSCIKILCSVIFDQTVCRHFNWVYYTRS